MAVIRLSGDEHEHQVELGCKRRQVDNEQPPTAWMARLSLSIDVLRIVAQAKNARARMLQTRAW